MKKHNSRSSSRRHAKDQQNQPTGGFPATLSSALRGALFALCALILLSACAAAIAYAAPDPDALTTPLALGVLFLSCLFGGWMAYRRGRRINSPAPIVCALLGGGMLMALLFVLSVCLPDSLRGQWPTRLAIGLRGGMLLFCATGAIMAAWAPRKRRKKRR